MNAVKFAALRLLKNAPLYTFLIVYIIFVQKHIGSGPFWHLMEKYFLDECTSGNQWVQNVFYVNNLAYDTGFDQYVKDQYKQKDSHSAPLPETQRSIN